MYMHMCTVYTCVQYIHVHSCHITRLHACRVSSYPYTCTYKEQSSIVILHCLAICAAFHFVLRLSRKPTTGIQYLVSVGLLEDSPLHVAKFLHEQVGLSKLRIGEFLGEIRMEFNMAVLK